MITFIKAQLKKSDEQTNIDKLYRVIVQNLSIKKLKKILNMPIIVFKDLNIKIIYLSQINLLNNYHSKIHSNYFM